MVNADVSSTRKITLIGGTSNYFFMFQFWDASFQEMPKIENSLSLQFWQVEQFFT